MSREWSVGNTGWQTPPEIFDRYAAEFGPFDLDAAGDPTSYASQHCGDFRLAGDETDGLSACWQGRVWVNPPYRNVEEWVRLGAASAKAGALVVMLLIPSTDAKWFHRYVWDKRLNRPREGVEVRFLEGRIRFIHPDPEKRETDFKGFRPISGNMLVVFHPGEGINGDALFIGGGGG